MVNNPTVLSIGLVALFTGFIVPFIIFSTVKPAFVRKTTGSGEIHLNWCKIVWMSLLCGVTLGLVVAGSMALTRSRQLNYIGNF